MTTFITTSVVVIPLLGFVVNCLLESDIRKSSVNIVFFALAILLVFSSFKTLYTGKMGSSNAHEGEVKILMKTHPFEF